ncbi:aldo/keto reductase, partial [Candidatus Gracilibacteria bacterium]|nr:aldo/keto reductase [Candidatus Gracilibacteria bacterium]
VEEGLIKNIGVSNFSVYSLKEAQSYSKNRIVANQVHYNLIFREPEAELLKYCQENDVLLVAWRPLELGKLANAGTAQLVDASIRNDKTHAQVAINYLTGQENVVTIFKSSDERHILEDLGGIGWKLADEEMKDLKENFGTIIEQSDVIPLG